MKIALVETDAQGGLIHFAYHLTEALDEEGHETKLFTGKNFELAGRAGSVNVAPILNLWPQVEKDRMEQQSLLANLQRKLRRVWRAVVLFREWGRLTVHLLREQPDVAIFSVIRFPMLFIFLGILRLTGMRLAQICHEFTQRDRKHSSFRRVGGAVQSLGYRLFDIIFFLSKDTQKEFYKSYRFTGASSVLPHPPQLLFHDAPIDRQEMRDLFETVLTDKVVLMFGLLRPSKGVDQLVAAFAQVPAKHNAKLVISGYPTALFDTKAVRQSAKSLGIEARSRFHFDYLPNEKLASLIDLADVVVFPYRNATASGALALAQSFGKPVIATRVGGLAEAIVEGETGILVPPEDPAALAAAIDDLLAHPEKAARIGHTAEQLLKDERSWKTVAQLITLQLTAKGQDSRDGGSA